MISHLVYSALLNSVSQPDGTKDKYEGLHHSQLIYMYCLMRRPQVNHAWSRYNLCLYSQWIASQLVCGRSKYSAHSTVPPDCDPRLALKHPCCNCLAQNISHFLLLFKYSILETWISKRNVNHVSGTTWVLHYLKYQEAVRDCCLHSLLETDAKVLFVLASGPTAICTLPWVKKDIKSS